MQPVFTTLFLGQYNLPLTVPDFPAWRCDICHYHEYDPEALLQLSQALGISRQQLASAPRLPPTYPDRPDDSAPWQTGLPPIGHA